MSENSQKQARAQVDSIIGLVKALEVDYDELENMREVRRYLQRAVAEAQGRLYAFSDDDRSPEKEEARDHFDDVESDLAAWEMLDGKDLAAMEEAAGEFVNREQVEERIWESPLSVEVRSDWHSPGSKEDEPSEFRILLCTGGPAVQLVGTLNQYGEPDSVRVEHQDWFESWQEMLVYDDEKEALLTYCRQFYYSNS